MKRALLIGIGVLLLLIVVSVWVYLLVFGVPEEADDVFANLNFGDSSTEVVAPPVVEPEPLSENQVDVSTEQALRQLTTRPVAGFTYLAGSSSDRVRYMERGTGHVYDIDIESGEEVRISATTIPRVVEANFSPQGDAVVIVTTTNFIQTTNVATIRDGALSTNALTTGAREAVFRDNNTIDYVTPTPTGSQIASYVLDTNNTVTGASIPFRDISMLWNVDQSGTDYFYNKTDHRYQGTLYRLTSNSFVSADNPKFGYSALVHANTVLRTYHNDDSLTTDVLNLDDQTTQTVGVTLIPDKCAGSGVNEITLWCGAEFTEAPPSYVTDWYKGLETTSDSLWAIDTRSGAAVLYISPAEVSGRTIDVYTIKAYKDDSILLFTNKIDDALWLYDTTL